jgi:hypothetical protein
MTSLPFKGEVRRGMGVQGRKSIWRKININKGKLSYSGHLANRGTR